MSRENVELVRQLQPDSDVDIARLFRDDAMASSVRDATAPFFEPDVEAVAKTSIGEVSGTGLDGLREVWLDWLKPWESYRTEIEDVLDAGNQAVVLVRDYGRRKDSDAEVRVTGAAVWTVRDGKITRVEFYADRAEALEAAGLSE